MFACLQNHPLADIRFGRTLVGLQQDSEGVTATIHTQDGLATLKAPFLLGADGAHSAARKLLGIEFEGMTYEERFLRITSGVAFDSYLPDMASSSTDLQTRQN
jgi:3-(3-hydroxy-phenyl)propionate hydroxylase